jgi:environmental stress-induced protein Ves
MAAVVAAPFWSTIATYPPEKRERYTYLRNVFASLIMTGPFSILLGFDGGLMALNDRLKLRSMVVGEKDQRSISPARNALSAPSRPTVTTSGPRAAENP